MPAPRICDAMIGEGEKSRKPRPEMAQANA
jgi:hypothetical protein